MAATPNDRIIGLTPVQRQIAELLENRIDMYIMRTWNRDLHPYLEFLVGGPGTPGNNIGEWLALQYAKAHWTYAHHDFLNESEHVLRLTTRTPVYDDTPWYRVPLGE